MCNQQIVTSMNDLCFDLVGVEKEKRDPKTIKTNQGKFIIIMPASDADNTETSWSDASSKILYVFPEPCICNERSSFYNVRTDSSPDHAYILLAFYTK